MSRFIVVHNPSAAGEEPVNNRWMPVSILVAAALAWFAPAASAHSPHDHIEAFEMIEVKQTLDS